MKPTDIRNPDVFHKVVDCQWACPAHTPVPEYIRLITAGRYADAYMVNWESNVFPGILGRTCDRPASRRAVAVGSKRTMARSQNRSPSAGFKRVAADHKGDVRGAHAQGRRQKNGSASRASARAPPPHGRARPRAARLSSHVFDADPKAGGFMRTRCRGSACRRK